VACLSWHKAWRHSMQVSCVKSRRFEIFRSNIILCGVVDIISLRVNLHHRCISIYIQGKIRKKGPSVDFKLNCAVEWLLSRADSDPQRQWRAAEIIPPSPAIPRLNYSTGEPIIFITIQFQSEKKKKKIFYSWRHTRHFVYLFPIALLFFIFSPLYI
jgi:hypothetical protein